LSENEIEYQLNVLYPPEEQRSLVLNQKAILIGRGEDCDLQFEDEWISRHHCKIWAEGSNIWVEDLTSTNGTFLDGQMIEKQNILPGSKVQVGKIVLTVKVDDPSSKVLSFTPQEPIQEEVVDTHDELDEDQIDTSEIISNEIEEEQDLKSEIIDLRPNAPVEELEEEPEEAIADNVTSIMEEKVELPNPEIDLSPSLNQWKSQLDNPSNITLFNLCIHNIRDFEQTPGQEAIRFLSLEIEALLNTEKISDEWISEILPGNFLFAVHSMNKDQAELFAQDLYQLIHKQIYSYQGKILDLDLSVGVVLLSADKVDFSNTWSQCSETANLAYKAKQEFCIIEE
jgi:pSer/pThr/pTyr-binding forkhead associated (FHA) protein